MKCVILIAGEKQAKETLNLPEAPLVGDEVGKLNGDMGYTIKVLKRRWIACSETYLVLEGDLVQ